MGKKKGGKKSKGTTVSLKAFLGEKAALAVKNADLPSAPRCVCVLVLNVYGRRAWCLVLRVLNVLCVVPRVCAYCAYCACCGLACAECVAHGVCGRA